MINLVVESGNERADSLSRVRRVRDGKIRSGGDKQRWIVFEREERAEEGFQLNI